MAPDYSAEQLKAIRAALARATEPTCPTAVAALKQSSSGGSGAFLVRSDDERRYWCKVLNNPQDPRVPINQQLVGRLGKWLGSAVCEASPVRIPSDLLGWEFRQGRKLEQGIAHGSRALEHAVETRQPGHTHEDENAERQTSLRVLAAPFRGQATENGGDRDCVLSMRSANAAR